MTSAVSAVVVTYNSSADIVACLAGLSRSGVSEIVVVDNASCDDGADIAEAAGAAVLRLRSNLGFGTAVNRVLLCSDMHYALIVNPDCVVSEATLAGLITALKSDPELAAVAPVMLYPDGAAGIAGGPGPYLLKEWLAFLRVDALIPRRALSWLASCRWLPLPDIRMSAKREFAPGITITDWVSGYCMLIRMDAFRHVGGFDERFFLYFEDADLCKRLRGARLRVGIVGNVSAIHVESTATSRVGKQPLYGAGMRRYFEIHGGICARSFSRVLGRLMGAI